MSRKRYNSYEQYKKQSQKDKEKYYGGSKRFSNGRRKWLPEEVEMIVAHEIPDVELAKILHRSIMSIQVKRCRIKNNYVY